MAKNSNLFGKINSVALLSNKVRLKILLALFNSEVFSLNKKKLGTHSHTKSQLKKIVEIERDALDYHLNLLIDTHLVDRDKKYDEYFHITEDGKQVLKEFGATKKLIQETGSKIMTP